jgi:hypothetical protein
MSAREGCGVGCREEAAAQEVVSSDATNSMH